MKKKDGGKKGLYLCCFLSMCSVPRAVCGKYRYCGHTNGSRGHPKSAKNEDSVMNEECRSYKYDIFAKWRKDEDVKVWRCRTTSLGLKMKILDTLGTR